jgi:site-specific recombinase XerD
MAEKFQTFLGTDIVGVTTISLLSKSLAPSTYANYDIALRQFFAFCEEENITPLQATPATMVRYTTWLGLLGTVAASSLQPYFSAVNKYFRDHQLPPIVVGDLLADARRPQNATTPPHADRHVTSDTRPRRPRHPTGS